MDPDFLNNLYLMGGLLAAMFVIVWRLTSASQKAVAQSINFLQLQIKDLADRMESGFARVEERLGKIETRLGKIETRLGKIETRLGKIETRLGKIETRLGIVETRLGIVETRLGKVEDRVQNLQMDMAVVKYRLDIPTSDSPASPVPARAGSPAPKAAAAEA